MAIPAHPLEQIKHGAGSEVAAIATARKYVCGSRLAIDQRALQKHDRLIGERHLMQPGLKTALEDRDDPDTGV